MLQYFLRKLRQFAVFSSDDESQLRELLSDVLDVIAQDRIIDQGSEFRANYLIASGMASRSRARSSGDRSLCGLLLPGDLAFATLEPSGIIDHSIITLSPCQVIRLDRQKLEQIGKAVPPFQGAMWRLAMADQSIARQWFLNLAQNPAPIRMAHLFCEIMARLQAVGLAGANDFELPLTQADLSELLGISPVHVNRVLQELRAAQLIVLSKKRLKVPDPRKLHAFAQFSPDYLHLAKA